MLIDLIFGRRKTIMTGIVGLAVMEYFEDGKPQAYSLKVRRNISIRRWGLFRQVGKFYVDIPLELQNVQGVIYPRAFSGTVEAWLMGEYNNCELEE